MIFANYLGVLETVNTNDLSAVQALRKAQPNRPVHVSESNPGWYDNWGAKHNTRHADLKSFETVLNDILFRGDASINVYMFCGSTNFGWQAAGNPPRQPVTTSYDFEGVISEAGKSGSSLLGKYRMYHIIFRLLCGELELTCSLEKDFGVLSQGI